LPVREVTADGGALAALAAPADRRDWWLARLARCHAILAAGRAGVPR
jgi:O-succinylbenzoate synthase